MPNFGRTVEKKLKIENLRTEGLLDCRFHKFSIGNSIVSIVI